MGRNRRGKKLDGWLILDKPVHYSSTQAMVVARRAFGAEKSGHGGTLDPLATGVLPVAFGRATKVMPFVFDARKRYRLTVRWGEARSTDDAEGEVIEISSHRPVPASIEAQLPFFTGEIEQIPPIHSAIKVGGQRSYVLARRSEPVTLAARRINIEALRLDSVPDEDHAVLDCVCGKGSYMRALARDLARALGTVGHVVALRRLAVGGFLLENAVAFDRLFHEEPGLADPGLLLALDAPLGTMGRIVANSEEASRLRRGAGIGWRYGGDSDSDSCEDRQSFVRMVDDSGDLIAIARRRDAEWVPVRVF